MILGICIVNQRLHWLLLSPIILKCSTVYLLFKQDSSDVTGIIVLAITVHRMGGDDPHPL